MSTLKAHLHQSDQRTGLKTHRDGRTDTRVVINNIIFPRGFYNTQHSNSWRAVSCQQTQSLLYSRATRYRGERSKDEVTLDRSEFSTASSCSGLELICNLNLPAFPMKGSVELIQGADDSGKWCRVPLQWRWAVVSEPSLTYLLGY